MTRRGGAPMRRRPAKPSFAAIDIHTFRENAFHVRPGVSNFHPRRHRWNLGSLPPPCLEYRGQQCTRAAISVLLRWCCTPNTYWALLHIVRAVSICVSFQNDQLRLARRVRKCLEVFESWLVKFYGSQGTQGTVFQQGC